METRVLKADHPEVLAAALRVLQRGGVVAFPTDTVYGIGVLATMDSAVARLYEVKDRNQEKSIPVLIGQRGHLDRIVTHVPTAAQALIQAFWPGPLTVVLPRKPGLPETLGPTDTVGVRMPDQDLARALLDRAGPLATTSANRSGRPSSIDPGGVLADLEGRIELLIDGGECPGGKPSTVLDCTRSPPLIVRSGPISPEAIRDILNDLSVGS